MTAYGWPDEEEPFHNAAIELAELGRWDESSKTSRVLASVFSMGVPVKPMTDAFGKANRHFRIAYCTISCTVA